MTSVIPMKSRTHEASTVVPEESFIKRESKLSRQSISAVFGQEMAQELDIIVWPFLICSPSSTWRITWDITMMVCMLYIFVFTPLEVTYSEPKTGGWTYLGNMVDILFWFDVGICFRTAYFNAEGELVTDPWEIATFYIKDFFFIDFLCCLPGFPLSMVIEKLISGSSAASSALKLGKAPRIVRVVRSVKFVKVLRVMKMAQYIDELRDSCPGSLIAMKMLKLLCLTSFFLHINACAFSMVSKQQAYGESWADNFDFENDWTTEYVNSLYWAATTATTVGYGDISPVSTGEKVFGIISMVMSVGIYGYIIGSMTDVVSSTSHINARYQQRMDEIFEFVKRYNLPRITRRQMIEFYRYHYQEKKYVDERRILDGLTPKLLEDVCSTVLQRGLARLRFFRSLEIKFFSRALNLLIPREAQNKGPDIISSANGPCPEFFILTEGHVRMYCPSYDSLFTKGAETHEERKAMVEVLVMDLYERFGEGDCSQGEGYLGAGELKQLMETMTKMIHTDDQIGQLLCVLDKDGNGTISQIEFTAWFLTHKVENVQHRVLGNSLAMCETNRPYGIWSAFNLGKGMRPEYVFVPHDHVTYWAINAEDLLSEFEDENSVLRLISATLVEPARKSGVDVDLASYEDCDLVISQAYSNHKDMDRNHEIHAMTTLVIANRQICMEEFEEKKLTPVGIKMTDASGSAITNRAGSESSKAAAHARKRSGSLSREKRSGSLPGTLRGISQKIDASFTAAATRRSRVDRQIFEAIAEKQSQADQKMQQQLSKLKEELKEEFRHELQNELQKLRGFWGNNSKSPSKLQN